MTTERIIKTEPLWKLVLNWGVVITFLTLPMVVLSIQMYGRTHPGWMVTDNPEHFRYLMEFQRNLTILVFGLAGLRTWENIKQNGRNNKIDNTTTSQ